MEDFLWSLTPSKVALQHLLGLGRLGVVVVLLLAGGGVSEGVQELVGVP